MRTVAATSSGSLRGASGPGRYCSVRPSKNRVRIPPGTSRVTPTRPASSVASARVKPTTPNFEAQYAVASPTALRPSVDATVTTRPPRSSRCGRAARTTAAVPKRLTRTTRSQSSVGTPASGPQASVPAAVTTASGGPTSSTSRSTAAAAAAESDRSAAAYGSDGSSGGARSTTAGVPPAFATAATTAAPRPLEPPVT